MPIQIDSVINEISPGASNESGEADNRWQKRQEVEAIHDEHQALLMRINAEDFDD